MLEDVIGGVDAFNTSLDIGYTRLDGVTYYTAEDITAGYRNAA